MTYITSVSTLWFRLKNEPRKVAFAFANRALFERSS